MKILLFIFLLTFLNVDISNSETSFSVMEQKTMVDSVNKIRQKGCYCGRRFMEPVGTVTWNPKLHKSALDHANDMHQNNFFTHYSKEGLNIGDRLEKVGYNWMVAGENLGEGQKSFDEVLNDWLESYSHCKMLMHPKVTEMGIAKVEKYWVQHFGKEMPRKP